MRVKYIWLRKEKLYLSLFESWGNRVGEYSYPVLPTVLFTSVPTGRCLTFQFLGYGFSFGWIRK